MGFAACPQRPLKELLRLQGYTSFTVYCWCGFISSIPAILDERDVVLTDHLTDANVLRCEDATISPGYRGLS